MINNEAITVTLFSAQAVAKNTSATSATINIDALRPKGLFSIQLLIAGDGTAKVEYLVSNDGTTFVDPVGATDIFTGFTKTSGTAGNGTDLQSFEPEPCRYLQIKVTETANANPITVTAVLCIM